MRDIVARMRCRTLMWNRGNGDVRDVPDEDCLEAADKIERLRAENERLREALKTYACRCGDGDCYKDEFVASCGRSAREALGLILNANSLPYAQEIASKALSEQDAPPCPTNTIK